MTDIQRYIVDAYDADDEGEFVTYYDHLAAVQQAGDFAVANYVALLDKVQTHQYDKGRRDERARFAAVTDEPDSHAGAVYRAGMADALDAAVQRVEALPWLPGGNEIKAEVIAAIKGGDDR